VADIPKEKVCRPVHVGVIPRFIAGVASDLIKVLAIPLLAVTPILAVGFAAIG
jgi:hypothetical protein